MPTFILPASSKRIARHAIGKSLSLQHKNRTSQRWAFLQLVLCLWLLGLQPTWGQHGPRYLDYETRNEQHFVYPEDEGGFGYDTCSSISITVQPISQTVCSANGIQFSVQANGTDLAYAWQYYDISGGNWVTLGPEQTLFRGFTTNTLTVSDDTLSNEQYQVQIRAVVSNSNCSVTSQSATFAKLASTVTITQQPTDQIACSSIGLRYSVQVRQEENLSYSWEFNDGKGWASVIADTNKYKGYNTGALTIKIDEPTGRQYRVKVNNGTCPIYSDPVTFTKLREVVITQQPISHTICSGNGKGLKYSVQATGDDLAYEWEFKDPTMTTWVSFSNFEDTYPDYNTPTLTANGVETPGRKYRVKILNECGTIYSDSATFTLSSTITITQQPVSKTACSGKGLQYSVQADGADLTFDWEFNDSDGKGWVSLSGFAPDYPGYNTATLTANGVETPGRQYRAKITSGCGSTVYSEAATFTRSPGLTISSQPLSQSACSGKGLQYTVKADGMDLTYDWEYSDGGGGWASLSAYASAYPGYNTATLTTNGDERDGRRYRAKITSGSCTVYSQPATFTRSPSPTISVQPVSQAACSGKGLQYSVQADGADLTYEWEYNDGGGWYPLSAYASAYPGYNTATLTTNGDEGNGRQYRAKITSGSCTVYSEAATFTQTQCAPTLTNFSASPKSVATGQSIEFTATVGGVTATYNYTLSNGAGSIQTGTASGSSFSQRLIAQGTGLQTYTLTIGDSPYLATGTVSVVVGSFAITGLTARANPVQSGQSVEFTATFEGLTNTDRYSYTLTNGQEQLPLTGDFYGSFFQESITARGAGVQLYTLTVATYTKGTATATISVTVIGEDVGLERFAISGVKDVSCETLGENQRQVRFTPQYVGISGSPISFSVVNELSPTTQPGPYTLRLYIDNPTITLVAQQDDAHARYTYNWLAHCQAASGSFTLTGARVVDCQLENPNYSQQYKVSLQPLYANQDNTQPISFSVVDELSLTTQPGPYTLHLWGDKPTITLVAQQGSAQARYTYNWLAHCATSSGSFALTGARVVDCQLENPNFSQQYKVSLQPEYANQDNTQPISFSVVDELSPTTQPGPHTLHLWGDKPTITLVAQQGNAQTRYTYNWLAHCQVTSRARRASTEEAGGRMQVKLLGNPIKNHQIRVEVKGVVGQPLELTLTDLSGRLLLNQRIEQSALVEECQLGTNPAWGSPLLLWVRVGLPTGSQQQTVKVIQEY